MKILICMDILSNPGVHTMSSNATDMNREHHGAAVVCATFIHGLPSPCVTNTDKKKHFNYPPE